jgi:hypothetical protein
MQVASRPSHDESHEEGRSRFRGLCQWYCFQSSSCCASWSRVNHFSICSEPGGSVWVRRMCASLAGLITRVPAASLGHLARFGPSCPLRLNQWPCPGGGPVGQRMALSSNGPSQTRPGPAWTQALRFKEGPNYRLPGMVDATRARLSSAESVTESSTLRAVFRTTVAAVAFLARLCGAGRGPGNEEPWAAGAQLLRHRSHRTELGFTCPKPV